MQPDDTHDDDHSLPLAARAMRALLFRRGHSKHKHAAVLAELTGLSYPQANRKLTGASGWDVDEFARLCGLLGESAAQVLEATQPHPAVHGYLFGGPERLPCNVVLGPLHQPGERVGFVAARQGAVWHVGRPGVLGGEEVHRVLSVSLDLNEQSDAASIAVLDDDQDACDSLCEGLENAGFRAEPFYSVKDLLAALDSRSFDGYVLDWLLPSGTVEAALGRVRSASPTAPIALLTGKLASGEAKLNGLNNALAAHAADYFAKPSPAAIIATSLRRGIEASRAGRGDS